MGVDWKSQYKEEEIVGLIESPKDAPSLLEVVLKRIKEQEEAKAKKEESQLSFGF
jgi:hypothetical protein